MGFLGETNYPEDKMNPILIISTLFGVTGALLTVFKKRGCWVAYAVSNIGFTIYFIGAREYFPLLQYAVFMTINIIGWIKWSKDIARKRKG